MTKDQLREKAANLPLLAGVYLMMDATGQVIYVGKAKKLKNRVSQYFQDSANHSPKTRTMVANIDHFDTIVVRNEFEALVLENSLIKRHFPRYNILLKDDKGYPFVRLGVEPYSRLTMVGRMGQDSARYFGPFGGRYETRQAIDAVCTALGLPTCNRKFPRDIGAQRPCLNFHMGKCDGYCRKELTQKDYQIKMEQAVLVLEGKAKTLLATLEQDMMHCAESYAFEQAAQIRDQITAVKALNKKQTVIAGLCADTDIWGIASRGGKCCYAVLHMEDGNLSGQEFGVVSTQGEEAELLSAITAQYYLPRSLFPKEILLPMDATELEDAETLSQVLTQRAGHRVQVRIPQRGEKAELVAMATQNAIQGATQAATAQERTQHTLETLQKALGLDILPERMESFDISNTGSSDIVASMVVYQGGKPLKKAYRRFQIKGLATGKPDDYASMEEVVRRRLQRYVDGDAGFAPLPEVMFIDGGLTHAQTAKRVVDSFGLAVPVFGMVKDDRHRTRALMTPEGGEIGIANTPAVFTLIGQIQEETHRFAITYHHQKHTKTNLRSALDGVSGLGEKRKQALKDRFGTIRAIKTATETELAEVIPKDVATALWKHLHPNGD
ncbi:excinuclease ABC subunit UvrC [Bengtsoniella intestinalis]|uniref:excinuclease ABC subunit UvrC n=1 Tax=Bengtsoniella intestinalis TaxID=3073143 RepID=UPI00391F6F68